jgi:hypothetical protein
MSRLRFAVPARIAHPRWRVSQARLRWAADLQHSDQRSGMSCGESLVSSVTQISTYCLLWPAMETDCAGFSPPCRSLNLPNGASQILAEPSNNSNLRAWSQLLDRFFWLCDQIATAEWSRFTTHPARVGHARLFKWLLLMLARTLLPMFSLPQLLYWFLERHLLGRPKLPFPQPRTPGLGV